MGRPSHVAIIGAGPLGGALAHKLAQRDRAATIRLIDHGGAVAAGKALDILQSAAVEGFATQLVGSSDVQDARGARVIVLADSASTGEWQGEAGLALLRQIAEIAEGGAIVCAGAAQRWLIARGVRELRLPRDRLLGSAPSALASAVRSLVALHVDGSPGEVALSLFGLPPGRIVIAWSSATIAGTPIDRLLTPAALAAIDARLPHLWPTGPYALASAAAAVVEAFLIGSRRTWSCFVTLDSELGPGGGTIAVPVRFDDVGRARVDVPELTTHERVRLESARQAADR